jgi:predicted nucleic acid-binding protein
MRRILFDINVILDVVFDRAPHADAAAALWRLVENKRIRGFIPAHGVTTIFYLAQKQQNRAKAERIVEQLLSVFEVAPVTAEILREALTLTCPDFEDAVCAMAGQKADCDFLVTRDPKGFRSARIRILEPMDALAALGTILPKENSKS